MRSFGLLFFCLVIVLATLLPRTRAAALGSAHHEPITRGLTEILERNEPPPVQARKLRKDGAIMVPGTRAIYTIHDGVIHLIPDWDTFCSLGYDMSHVDYVAQQKFNSYKKGPDLKSIGEAGARDYSEPCPCKSKSRNPLAVTANTTTHPRNICILKNKPMVQLFTEVYELNMLQRHLRFFLIDNERLVNEEAFRWKLYNETVREQTNGGNFTNKYTDYKIIGDFSAADAEDAPVAASPNDKVPAAATDTAAATATAAATGGWVYDSDVDPYPSPFFNNGHAPTTTTTHRHRYQHLRMRRLSENSNSKTTKKRKVKARAEGDRESDTDCDVIIEIMPDEFDFASHVCPGVCKPHARAHVPIDLLLPEPKHPDKDLTCSLTLEGVFETSDTSALDTATTVTQTRRAVEDTITEEPNKKDVAHARLAMILHSLARRKIEECLEKEFWLPPVKNRLHKNTIALHKTYTEDPPKHKVRGLIVWIGSISRFSMARAQIEILKSQTNVAPADRIVGWLATEEIYSCGIGTTTCTTLSPALAYYHYMPTSKLNVEPAGYNCAQRRPLRAMSHVLHLFDPGFLFVVDDDTWVNIAKLALGSPLDHFIKENMSKDPVVMGQLTQGKKITRKGFFYGGAGYLMGRGLVEKLASSRIMGPPDHLFKQNDPLQTTALQIMMQALENSRASCKSCIIETERTKALTDQSNGPDAYVDLEDGARLVDACMNIMSEEHTCYASDHAVSRCLVHGANAVVIDVDCGWGSDYESSVGKVHIGMCMGIDECVAGTQLTCHRWMADPADYNKPIASAWTESDD